MEWLKGFFGSFSSLPPPPAPSLAGRETPIDLLEKGTFRVRQVHAAQFSVEGTLLTVNIPKQHKKRRKDYVMQLYASVPALMDDICEAMAYDRFETMTAVQLAAEYPVFFWNGMFHCSGQVDVLEAQMQKHGIPLYTAKRRRRNV